MKVEGEQQPVRVKAPPPKRRAVIRVESAETQDYVSGQQGFEDLGQEEAEELGSVPSAVSGPQWTAVDIALVRQSIAEKKASSSSNLRPL